MKNLYFVALFAMLASYAAAQTAVTLQVDMNQQTVSPDGVHVAGSFQGWDPTATPLNDLDMDGIWEVTLDLVSGMHEYKFINGMSWDFVEDVPPACQVEVAGNDNRFIVIAEEETELSSLVCYESCAACGMTTVRMRVDMNIEDAISPAGVHIAGNFQGWDASATALSDANEDGVWEAMISFVADSIADGQLIYKFINGNAWSNPNEDLAGADCAGEDGNRVHPFTDLNMVLFGDSATNAAPCFNSCGTCMTPTMVTFQVDMNTQESVSVNGVHIAGSFQGWSPSANPLNDDDGDGIWEAVLPVAPGDIQFKFVNGNDWSGNGDGNIDNELVIGDCAAEGSDNRLLSVGSDDLVYTVCYNSCDEGCVENPDPADVIFRVDMSEEEVNAAGVWVIGNFTDPNWQMGALQMTDIDADGVFEVTANVSGASTVLYKFVNGDPSAGDQGVDYIEESGVQLDENNEEVATFETDGCGLPNGFGAYNRIHERSGEDEILESVCFNKCSSCIVSVQELNAMVFEAYPNPFDEQLTLILPPAFISAQLVVSDVSGRVMDRFRVNGDQASIVLSTSNWSVGTYFIHCETSSATSTQMLLKH
jgi:hypothetical protein